MHSETLCPKILGSDFCIETQLSLGRASSTPGPTVFTASNLQKFEEILEIYILHELLCVLNVSVLNIE